MNIPPGNTQNLPMFLNNLSTKKKESREGEEAGPTAGFTPHNIPNIPNVNLLGNMGSDVQKNQQFLA
jgi:hypothetical protein